jgi:hypothetical protein
MARQFQCDSTAKGNASDETRPDGANLIGKPFSESGESVGSLKARPTRDQKLRKRRLLRCQKAMISHHSRQ